MISFAFMLKGVPAPAWTTSSLKSVSNLPSLNSFAACSIAFPKRGSRVFSFMFAFAAASFTRPKDLRNMLGARMDDI